MSLPSGSLLIQSYPNRNARQPRNAVFRVALTCRGEVEALCAEHGLDVADVRRWYDGYDLPAFGTGPGGPTHVAT